MPKDAHRYDAEINVKSQWFIATNTMHVNENFPVRQKICLLDY